MLFIGMGKGNTTEANSGPLTRLSGSAAIAVNGEQNIPAPYTGVGGGFPPDEMTAVQAFFLLNFFDPCQGYSSQNPSFTIKVSGLDQFKLNGTFLGMPASATIYVGATQPAIGLRPFPTFEDGGGRGGGVMDFRVLMGERKLGSDASTQFPFYSNFVNLSNTGAGIAVLFGANLTIEVYAGNSTAAGDLIQTYTI